MKKITFLCFSMLLFVTVASAQSEKASWRVGTYKHANWFASVAGGAQVYWGEEDRSGSFGKRISPEIEVSVGKWFTHVWGARIQYDGFDFRGWSPASNAYSQGGTPDSKGLYEQKFNYMNFHFDVLFNLNSAICPNSRRVYELIPYVGVGFARGYKSDKPSFNSYSVNGGLINRFRISRVIDLNLTLKAMIVNQGLDQEQAGRTLEGKTGVTAGVTFKF